MPLEDIIRDRQNIGLGAGWAQGAKEGVDLRSTVANTNRTNIESDRMSQMTPHVVEQARLANLPGQANEQQGVYQAKAREEALRAQEALKTLPIETQQKLRSETIKRSNDLLQIAEQTLMSTGSTEATLQAMVQAYPDMQKDKGWQEALGKYNRLTPEELMSEIKQKRAALASSNFYADPAGQGDMIKQDQKHGHDLELQRLRNEGEIGAARERSSKPDTSMNPTEALLMLSERLRTEQDPRMRQWLAYQIDLISKAQIKTDETPLGERSSAKTAPIAPGMEPKTVHIPKEALTHLLNNPDTAEQFEQHYGIQKGWAQKYLDENKRK